MTENERIHFSGTYFNRDAVLRLARLADIFSWVVLAYYVAQAGISVLVFVLQIVRGLVTLAGLTDYLQQSIWLAQPIVPGLLYFVGIQAMGHATLILMDIEDNLRRAARNKS